ncbi:flagellar basal body-associated FliL family protein [Pontiella agarivorans]|uniref:Flagellar protein FliL n=1 Tax=Pontiella agarivorans TaxID=3038953 RepID=A0ABU5MSW8_9BACT|nr:flagellar basal body-associated FliL family protein [Pontiella agarivorans]MDZ8117293.1 flagellar basal body-associated FliL family protein [Pontiella agarivorans]
MAEENDIDKSGTENEGTGKKGKGVILIAVLGVVLIAGGIGTGLVLGKKSRPVVTVPKKNPDTPVIVQFKDLYVNIAETKATRVLKLTVVLELSEEKLTTPLEAHRAIIRDLISEAASRMTIDELEGRNGRSILKREIKNRVNDLVRDRMAGAVIDVYFSDFLIQ